MAIMGSGFHLSEMDIDVEAVSAECCFVSTHPEAAITPPRDQEPRFQTSHHYLAHAYKHIPIQIPIGTSYWADYAKIALYWLDMLYAKNKSCLAIPKEPTLRLTVAIFRDHTTAVNFTYDSLKRECLAASLWVSIKFVSVRSALPNASFISAVTHIPKAKLLKAEVDIITLLNWDVYKVAKEALPFDIYHPSYDGETACERY